ncbi:UvrD-helicase domain-containing protein [Nocardia flavorosea]|uniref:3'-5' exonuclease n=1 Tax=Nocardia flavorosea TaxID=53429 RepID=UPI001895FDC5|nr:3'-5' exonuclease [Nocardia flavorosea]MBF6352799.1 UvrD-helicase domain-containing protein [Nocardia flavorosea]
MAIFEQKLADQKAWTHETVCREAVRILESSAPSFRHVVVDEAQDLSPDQWRLIRAAVAPGADDIFLAGDTHQRIYDNVVSLREVGVNVTGRSRKLAVNYRTTAEILRWSMELLHGEPIDDMDGGFDSIAGCRSDLRGPAPDVRGFATEDDELRHLADTVRGWLERGVEAGEIGIAARSRELVNQVRTALGNSGIPTDDLAKAADGKVNVGTMHRMKGLEFRCLGVVGVGAQQVPPAAAITPPEEDRQAHARDLQRERCLLFVACTRAREELLVTWHSAPSPLLPTSATGSERLS